MGEVLQTIEEYAMSKIEKDKLDLVSLESTQISEQEAVITALEWEDKDGRFCELRTYIVKDKDKTLVSKGDLILVVGFISPKEYYEHHEALFKKALETIKIK